MDNRSLQLFALQMGVLLGASVRISEALRVAGQSENRILAQAVGRVLQAVAAGSSLSQAFEQQEGVFPPVFVRLAGLAEKMGGLVLIFPRLADYLGHRSELRRRLVAATLYPACVLAMCLGLAALLKFWMLPVFLGLVQQTGVPLPWLTRLATLNVHPAVWIGMGVALVGLGEGLWLTWRSPQGRQRLETTFFRLPGPGRAAWMAIWCRIYRDLATLLSAGLPLLSALTFLCKFTTGSHQADQALQSALKGIRLGRTLTETLGQDPAVPGMMRHLLAAGEVSGRLPECMSRCAEVQEEVLRLELDSSLRLLEPLLMTALGLGVGLLLLASFLPVYQLMLTT